jgi:hypothetical protein
MVTVLNSPIVMLSDLKHLFSVAGRQCTSARYDGSACRRRSFKSFRMIRDKKRQYIRERANDSLNTTGVAYGCLLKVAVVPPEVNVNTFFDWSIVPL